jgi:hypothetical protein
MNTTFEELENFVKENFLVADPGILRLVVAVIIANRLPGDPVWLFIISPPSGFKSEIIRAMDGIHGIYHLSSLTPKTLISGQQRSPGSETSLLMKVNPGTIFTFKDFTTILQMNYVQRDEIFSQLREVYDGQFKKTFGTGLEVDWKGKIGFIAGVTEAVDIYQKMYSTLGERFLQYRMTQPDRKSATRMGMANSDKIYDIRKQMNEKFKEHVDGINFPDVLPTIPNDWIDEIIDLSEFATLARSGSVVRDTKTHEIMHNFTAEMPVRFAKQLTLLAQAFLIMGLRDGDRRILRKVALTSLPKNRIDIFAVLLREKSGIDFSSKTLLGQETNEIDDDESNADAWTASNVALALGLSTSYARRNLEELTALGLLTKYKFGNSHAWKIKDEYLEFLLKYYRDEQQLFDRPDLFRN